MTYNFEFLTLSVTVEIELTQQDTVNWRLYYTDADNLHNEYSINMYPSHEGDKIKVSYSFVLKRPSNCEELKSYSDYYYERRLRMFYTSYLPPDIQYGDWAGMQAINGLVARLPVFRGSKEKSDYGYRIFDSAGEFYQPVVFDVESSTETASGNDGGLHITVHNAVGSCTYSLDGLSYQSGEYFSDLAAGDYLVYVKDEAGTIRYKPVNIGLATSLS